VTDIPAFDDYVRSLGRLTAHIDPTAASPEAAEIKEAAARSTACTASPTSIYFATTWNKPPACANCSS
jgi:hypothetical protein